MSAPELLEWCTGLLACHSWNRTVTKGCRVISSSGFMWLFESRRVVISVPSFWKPACMDFSASPLQSPSLQLHPQLGFPCVPNSVSRPRPTQPIQPVVAIPFVFLLVATSSPSISDTSAASARGCAGHQQVSALWAAGALMLQGACYSMRHVFRGCR